MASNNKNSNKLIKLIFIVALVLIAAKFLFPAAPDNPVEPQEDDDKEYYHPASSVYSSQWAEPSNVEIVVPEATEAEAETAKIRPKYTKILGNNKDTITVMVYMCGTDLESQGSMATYDLNEMVSASYGDNVRVIVFTGGCKKWHVNGISTKVNEIFRVYGDGRKNNFECLTDNAGNSTMVNPDNLESFIEFCEDNYEANRYALILWDHGGGTVSGYGYDEKYPSAGSMTLDEIDEALTEADVKFDFIGFDACLMATTENAIMLSEHADYMIASEESEPGIGWYYTTWLNAVGKNTSLPTVEIGKSIIDSFVSQCRKDTPRQSATLSVVDLAELQATVPSKLTAFAKSASQLIADGQYKTVANARGGSRDFGASSKVDMVDLVDFASKLKTDEAKELKDALLSCIKYNNTSSDMTNSYGLSIFFPYRSNQYVSTVLGTYKNMDMDSDYCACIKDFATYQASGQIASGGTHNPYQSFESYSGDSYYSQQGSADAIYELLELFMNGGLQQEPQQQTTSNYSDFYGSGLDWLFGTSDYGSGFGGYGKSLANFVAQNHFDADLSWKDGKIKLTEDQWKLVTDLQLNIFVDDGTGYIDLGKDNIYEIDKEGNLLKQSDLTWIAASADKEHWQVVPYYYISSQVSGEEVISTGRIPVLLNGQLANLMVKMDDAGIEVIGACFDYTDTAVLAKSFSGLNPGDEIQFVCDFYDYDGNFQSTHQLGDKLIVKDGLFLGDVSIADYKTLANYQFTDIYQQNYWTDAMK